MSTIRYTRQLLWCVLAVLCAVVSIWSVWHVDTMIDLQSKDVRDKEARIASYAQNKKIFEDETSAVVELRRRIQAAEGQIITEESIPTLLSSIESLGTLQKVPITITSAQTSGKQKDKLTVGFTAAGTMGSIDAFLRSLEHQVYQIKFTKLSLYVDPDTKGQWSVQGEMQITSFGL